LQPLLFPTTTSWPSESACCVLARCLTPCWNLQSAMFYLRLAREPGLARPCQGNCSRHGAAFLFWSHGLTGLIDVL